MANKKKSKHSRQPKSLSNSPSDDAPPPPPSTPPLTPPPSPSLGMAPPRARLLIASLGNPGPYVNTRHSIGHLVLRSLAPTFAVPALSPGKLVSGTHHPEYSFYQSGSFMNKSGTGVVKAYERLIAKKTTEYANTIVGLVVLHDELDREPGDTKIRKGTATDNGHNGIKSVMARMKERRLMEKGIGLIRIGIGIGRPKERNAEQVVPYVMAEPSLKQLAEIQSCVLLVKDFLERMVYDTEEDGDEIIPARPGRNSQRRKPF